MVSASRFIVVPLVHFCTTANGILLRDAAPVTPVEKVTTLLEDLKTEVESDGKAEASAYGEYACFCKDTTKTKSGSITDGQDSIELLSADIAEKTATQGEKSTELHERKVKQEELTVELKETTERCAREKAEYDAKNADLTKAISSLDSASKAMSKSKPSLLELHQSNSGDKDFQRTLAFAEVLGFVKAQRKQAFGVLNSFLQQGVDPVDPEFKYHSQGIIDTIDELLVDFRKESADVNAEWAKTKKSCDDTKKSLNDEMTSNSAAIVSLGEAIAELKAKISTARGELISAENVLKDDQVYLKDLTSQCEKRAKDWDQRSQLRADELEALSKAITILTNDVSSADTAVNKRALLVEKRASGALTTSTYQSKLIQRLARGPVSFIQENTDQAQRQKRQQHALALLHSEGLRLHSTTLLSVPRFNNDAAKDPFAKVKQLIQNLVERLLAESTAEATKKGFCDTEMGKATQNRDNRFAEANKLNVEIAGLETKQDVLEADIENLKSSLSTLRTDLNQSTVVRAGEKVVNIETIQQAKEGLKAVTDALAILKDFYKSAAKAEDYLTGKLDKASLVQNKWSPVQEDTSGPGFDNAYSGKQEASTSIIGILSVIKSDFERTIKTTASSEKQAAADHVEFDRASKTDISGKSTKKELNSEDLQTTKNTIEQKMSDLQAATDLLDNALKELEELNPVCVDMTMPYAERVQKREDEMEALKKALCILDTESVEADCAKR